MLVYTRFEKLPLVFRSPREIISCHAPSGLEQCFSAMESLLDRGYYLAGYVSYEAGYGFEGRLACDRKHLFPLLYMGCYGPPQHSENFGRDVSEPFRVSNIRPALSFQDYRDDIRRIRDFIAAGEVYQITYCLKMKFAFAGSAPSLFRGLLRRHPMPYPAYVEAERFRILSLSPELFMKKNGTVIHTKPMKGTWPRGANVFADLAARFRLKYDEKNRAENVMIADLLRNDLGRIGRRVRVPRLFEVSSYATLFQMTSTVSADIDRNIPLYTLFKALFPSGSVTGAPKIRAMQVIRGLEREERRIYTGAIGYITPDRSLVFNVPIRTLLIEDGQGEMGVGGGIIWDSTPDGEWAECMLKAKFLADQAG